MKTEEVIEMIASACHQTNKDYCESIGDYSQPDWEDAPDWLKNSIINGVKYRLDNPDVTNEEMHNNWMKVKIEDGWVYGETKDPDNKTHPCLMPYDELPEEQKAKDMIFVRTINTMLYNNY